ncbi:unnamed protein product [Paramecium sonneborni]|uniref:Uncharacterized protein n=1 Tax=Paramecium sonneborni TaxID=65129 RepID=A0A8S1LB43_9CILI|nr:unnamed protein product [Paramecium sonneborni]
MLINNNIKNKKFVQIFNTSSQLIELESKNQFCKWFINMLKIQNISILEFVFNYSLISTTRILLKQDQIKKRSNNFSIRKLIQFDIQYSTIKEGHIMSKQSVRTLCQGQQISHQDKYQVLQRQRVGGLISHFNSVSICYSFSRIYYSVKLQLLAQEKSLIFGGQISQHKYRIYFYFTCYRQTSQTKQLKFLFRDLNFRHISIQIMYTKMKCFSFQSEFFTNFTNPIKQN